MSLELIIAVVFFIAVVVIQKVIYDKKLKSILDEKSSQTEEVFQERIVEPLKKESIEDISLENEVVRLKGIIEDTKTIAQNATMIKSDFLTNIRHEIRTPMNSILVFSKMIRDESLDADISEYARNVFSSGNNLLGLLNNIIEMSEMDSGKFKIHEKAIETRHFLNGILDTHRYEAQRKSLDFSVHIDHDIPESIVVDTQRIKEILDNLISNALKFTHEGEVKFSVVLNGFDEVKHEADISFRVEDTGIGILKENQEKIFKVFESKQTGNKLEYQGTGLGLSINKKLAILMGGTLKVESQVEEGSTFTLRFKNIEAVVMNEEYDDETTSLDFSRIKHNSSLVVIDDSQETLGTVSNCFKDTSVKTFVYETPRDAISMLRKTKVDLIVINVEALSEDDNAVAKILRKLSEAPIVSLVNDSLRHIEFHEEGVKPIAHLKKPLTKIELFRTALRILNGEEIGLENSSTQDIASKKSLSFRLDEQASRNYFNDTSIDIEGLLQESLETNDLNAITRFANAIHELSLKHQVQSLIPFSQKLLKTIDLFDIQGIDTMLKEYDKKSKEFLT